MADHSLCGDGCPPMACYSANATMIGHLAQHYSDRERDETWNMGQHASLQDDYSCRACDVSGLISNKLYR